MAPMYYEVIKKNVIYSHQKISKTYVFVCVWSYTKRGNNKRENKRVASSTVYNGMGKEEFSYFIVYNI